MRKTMMIVVLVAAATAVGAADFNLPHGKWWENERVVQRIGLTEEQQSAISDLVYQHALKMIDLNAGLKKAEFELGDLVDRDDFDPTAVRKSFGAFQAAKDKLDFALGKMVEEDPTFRVREDEETGQTLISGMGELHLEVIVDRLRREYSVQANVGKPQVVCRETIDSEGEAAATFERELKEAELFGEVAPGGEETLKVKLNYWRDGVVKYLEFPQDSALDLTGK